MSAWDLERGAVELSARIDEAVSGWVIGQFDQQNIFERFPGMTLKTPAQGWKV